MTVNETVDAPAWEHFPHQGDVGIRGFGASKAEAFENAARAMSAVVVEPGELAWHETIEINCSAPDDEILLLDWLNAIIFEMATRSMVFGDFHVELDGTELKGEARGEPVEVRRHAPVVELKGATMTELKVTQTPDGRWLAQCIVDV